MVSNVSCSHLPYPSLSFHGSFGVQVFGPLPEKGGRCWDLRGVNSIRPAKLLPLEGKKTQRSWEALLGILAHPWAQNPSLALCKWENWQQFAFASGFAETGLLRVRQQQIVAGHCCSPQPPGNTELENLVESLNRYFGSRFLTCRKMVNTLFQWMADRPEGNYAPQYKTSHINKAQFSAGDSVGNGIWLQILITKHCVTLTLLFKICCWPSKK